MTDKAMFQRVAKKPENVDVIEQSVAQQSQVR